MIVTQTMPVRIGAVCRDLGVPCPDTGPEEKAHSMPNFRFMVLAYATRSPAGADPPFDKCGIHDPPVEAQTIEIPDEVTSRFLTMVHYN